MNRSLRSSPCAVGGRYMSHPLHPRLHAVASQGGAVPDPSAAPRRAAQPASSLLAGSARAALSKLPGQAASTAAGESHTPSGALPSAVDQQPAVSEALPTASGARPHNGSPLTSALQQRRPPPQHQQGGRGPAPSNSSQPSEAWPSPVPISVRVPPQPFLDLKPAR